MKAAVVAGAVLGLIGGLVLAAAPAWSVATVQPPITVGTAPVGVTFNPAGTRGYAAISSSNKVAVVDRATGTVLTPVTVGNGPMGVAFLPSGTKAYVPNYADDSVTVFDPATGSTLSTITVGDSPFFIAVSPDGTRAYVPNSFSSSVSVINTATDAVIATVMVKPFPVAVAVNPASTRAYVANSTGDVSVIDVATSTVIATIPLAGQPYGVAVSPDGARVFVSQYSADTVSVISTTTNTVVGTVNVGNEPEGVTFNPAGTKVYIPTVAGSVSVIDVATLTALAPIPSGSKSRILAFTPDGTLAYVSNTGADTLTVIAFDLAVPTISGTPGASTRDVAYSFTPTVTGAAVTVTLQSGPLPAGLSLAGGAITGTPTSTGSYPITLRAENDNGFADLSVTITVALPVPTITGSTPAAATVGSPFSWSATVTGLPGYAVTSTVLPAGLVMDAAGAISGTPTGSVGSTAVILTVTDAGGTDTFTLTIDVAHGAAQTLTVTPSDATPAQGDTVTLTVMAFDSAGNSWDVSSSAVITSDVASDVVVANQVTFPHASPHRLTATLGRTSASITVQVSAATGVLGLTGGAFAWWLAIAAAAAVAAGVVLVRMRRAGATALSRR